MGLYRSLLVLDEMPLPQGAALAVAPVENTLSPNKNGFDDVVVFVLVNHTGYSSTVRMIACARSSPNYPRKLNVPFPLIISQRGTFQAFDWINAG